MAEQMMAATAEDILEPDLPICDPHHHLWDFPTSHYFLPELLADLRSGHNVQSTVFAECDVFYRADGPEAMRPVGETEFVNGVAAMAASGHYGPILVAEGIVGRANLDLGARVEDVLVAHIHAGGGRFRGIRHAATWDADPRIRRGHTNPSEHLYALPAFREGFAKLAPLKMSFEAWQYHPQLLDVADLAEAFPDTTIILNHVGGLLGLPPYDKRADVFAHWKRGIQAVAANQNVVVKLGGLGMSHCGFGFHKRAVPPSSEDLAAAWRPYVETCIEAFGPERAMFESNFPVDKVSCSYANLWNAFKRIVAGASAAEKALLFRDTARRVYRLPSRSAA